MSADTEFNIARLAANGDGDYARYWEAIQSDHIRSDLIQKSTRDAMKKLLQPKYFLFADENAVASEPPIAGLDALGLFGKRKTFSFTGCFLVSKASPLKKPLDIGNTKQNFVLLPLSRLTFYAACSNC